MKKHGIAFIVVGLVLNTSAIADGFSLHADLGYANPKFSSSSVDTWMNTYMQNRYSITSKSKGEALFGIGAAYEWGFGPGTLNLGASAYYVKTNVSGVNSPFINVPFLYAPGLNYSASGNSYAVMLEPKLISTKYHWQPYVFGGLGVGINTFNGYSETPIDSESSASPTRRPFANKTSTGVAYEVGIGIQHALSTAVNAPILALDYRYMNWGNAGLGNTTENANNNLNFGDLNSGIATLSLIWPFSL